MDLKIKGKIMGLLGGLYTVRVKDGEEYREISCRARGVFRHGNTSPMVGDDVFLDVSEGEQNAVINEISDRKNSLIRPPLANLDTIFVTMAASSPKPMLDMTDKLTAILEHNDITPVIVVGKCELDREYAAVIKETYEKAGYRVFVLSCATGEGIDEIQNYINTSLDGKIAAFAGASGVGKSTLMNKLFPTLELGTGDVSRKTARGKHTTRAVTLFPIGENSFLADTPGFSMLDFERFDFFDLEQLPLCFPEINDRIGECKYTKCTHLKEEGCAIVEAVKRGEIAKSRHESYVMLYDILKNKHKWDK
ncbi:MAG: ribosome small subunit-dependent GTPase A [Clostridia bacterium]|nr:ribosome small subunit-dependent GTPase A [Clostridia bacterium]